MKTVPYNTGKVLIGVAYQPPVQPQYMDADACLLQRALLGERRRVSPWVPVAYAAAILFILFIATR